MSDVSVASSSCRYLSPRFSFLVSPFSMICQTKSFNVCFRSRQLIAHSSRVPPPQRHHSESVLYLGNQSGSNWQGKGDRSQQLKLFPVNTYTVQPNEQRCPSFFSGIISLKPILSRINFCIFLTQSQQTSDISNVCAENVGGGKDQRTREAATSSKVRLLRS